MPEATESGLLIEERRRRIRDLLRDHGRVTVDALASRFGTSQVTIRADLSALETVGALTRTHGGAVPSADEADAPLGIKKLRHHAEKVRIANAALCADTRRRDHHPGFRDHDRGDCPRPAHVAPDLHQRHHQRAQYRRTAAGSAERAPDRPRRDPAPGVQLTLRAGVAESALANLQADRVYLGADAIDPEIGVMTPHLGEARLNAEMIRISQQVVVVADSSKLQRRNISLIAKVDQLDMLITDRGAPDQAVEDLRTRGVEVRLV